MTSHKLEQFLTSSLLCHTEIKFLLRPSLCQCHKSVSSLALPLVEWRHLWMLNILVGDVPYKQFNLHLEIDCLDFHLWKQISGITSLNGWSEGNFSLRFNLIVKKYILHKIRMKMKFASGARLTNANSQIFCRKVIYSCPLFLSWKKSVRKLLSYSMFVISVGDVIGLSFLIKLTSIGLGMKSKIQEVFGSGFYV